MLARCFRQQQQHQAQWRHFVRGLTFVAGGKCKPPQPNSYDIGASRLSAAAPGDAVAALLRGIRIPPARLFHTEAVNNAYLDQYFVDNDMREPIIPLVPVPQANRTLQSHVETIWQKAAAANNHRDFIPVLKAWIQEGNILTRDIFYKLVIRMMARMMFYPSYKLAAWVHLEQPFPVTDFDHLVRLYFAVKELKYEKARGCFNKIEQKNETAYVLYLQALATAHRKRLAENLFKEMKQMTIITHPYSYNLMIAMYIRKGMFDAAKALLTEMKEKSNVHPDMFTYWILIRSKKDLNMDDLEVEIEEYLADVEGTKTGFDWKNLILLNGAMNKKLEVKRLWSEKKGAEFLPESYLLAAMEAFGMNEEMDMVEAISKRLESQNGKLTDRHCFTLLKVYSMNGKMIEAERMLEKLDELGFKRGFRVFHYAINGYLKRKQLGKAIEKFNEAEEKCPAQGFKNPLFVTVLSLLEAYANRGDVEKAEKLVKRVLETERYPCDIRLFNTLLRVYYRAKQPAWDMERRIKEANLHPNEESYKLIKKLWAFNP